jgi:hypothetical protein
VAFHRLETRPVPDRDIEGNASIRAVRDRPSWEAPRPDKHRGSPIAVQTITVAEEHECKLAGDAVRLDELPGQERETRISTSVYYKTDDLRLAGLGLTLRRRLEQGRNLWQLKLQRADSRVEVEEGGG